MIIPADLLVFEVSPEGCFVLEKAVLSDSKLGGEVSVRQ